MAAPPPPPPQDVSSTTEAPPPPPVKQHHLASCLWASTGYATRGNRFAINDGQRRLLEWITYHKLIGVDHFYLYDNSGAFSNDDSSNSLHPIAELFPEDVTVIDWPSRVCNNNPNNVDRYVWMCVDVCLSVRSCHNTRRCGMNRSNLVDSFSRCCQQRGRKKFSVCSRSLVSITIWTACELDCPVRY
jgi:hypothetical protein